MKRYVTFLCRDGITLCVRVFNKTASWEGASQTCDEHNSDLLNIRTLEQLMYGTSIYDAVLKKIEIDSKTSVTLFLILYTPLDSQSQRHHIQIPYKFLHVFPAHKQPHWCGLRLTDGKLYWDSDTPSPDRDRTPNRWVSHVTQPWALSQGEAGNVLCVVCVLCAVCVVRVSCSIQIINQQQHKHVTHRSSTYYQGCSWNSYPFSRNAGYIFSSRYHHHPFHPF